ncbi:MAG: rRNA processing protein RimM [Frankiales bacterium]|nr:rRNA processing protein RimM [Frankiales bacterium]
MARVAGHRRRSATAPPAVPDPSPDAVEPASTDGLDLSSRDYPGPPSASPADLLVVGRIGKPQGIRGEVTVQVRTDDPEARFAVGSVLLTDPVERGPLTVESSRLQNGRLMVLFAGVADRNDAERLRETLLQVDAATLPPPEDADEFHDHVLRGMAVRLVEGRHLGEVADVLHLPHGDVLVVRRADNGAEVLVPFVRAMVPEVDVPARSLVVDPPPGLLDLTDDPPGD